VSRSRFMAFVCALAVLAVAAPARAAHNEDQHLNMELLFTSPTGAVNSDIAFWGDRAFVGNYNGFRIFDVSDPARPTLLSDFECFGPQNDPSVWDTDANGEADLLILSIDRTLTGPRCGATATEAHGDPTGWEGLRLFDVGDPTAPRFIKGIYQDCGSHTNTLLPQLDRGRLLVLNSSYPLRPGPTCGPERGPAADRDPLHGVMQVVEVPLANPALAAEITELPINYPGDPDNVFDPDEHALHGLNDLRACHDQAVFVELGLVAAACAEQAQLWRIDPETGLPDTADPLWVYDEPAVDFWHSATFTWDGKVVNFIDESFGAGCPTFTPGIGQTGRMFFVDRGSGLKLSDFKIERGTAGDPISYCSAHLGNVVPSPDRYLLVNAWYRGGADVIDFTDPASPREIAFYDKVNADNWSAYWYERTGGGGSTLPIFGNDGVHDPETGAGFESLTATVGPVRRVGLDHLNPQVQEEVIGSTIPRAMPSTRAARKSARKAASRSAKRRGHVDAAAVKRRLAP